MLGVLQCQMSLQSDRKDLHNLKFKEMENLPGCELQTSVSRTMKSCAEVPSR